MNSASVQAALEAKHASKLAKQTANLERIMAEARAEQAAQHGGYRHRIGLVTMTGRK
jgi:hypothetical protein